MNNVMSLAKLGAFTDVNLLDALMYSLLGVVIIFSMLTVLIISVLVYRMVFDLMSGKKNSEKKNEVKEQPKVETKQPEAVAVTSDDEIAAVIGAVMAIYYSETATGGKPAPFRVKSILRLK